MTKSPDELTSEQHDNLEQLATYLRKNGVTIGTSGGEGSEMYFVVRFFDQLENALRDFGEFWDDHPRVGGLIVVLTIIGFFVYLIQTSQPAGC